MADQAERAARLAKADLVTGMVGEFPELQGVIGGYLARVQGEPDAVAHAIRDHYKPVGQGDEVPTAPVTVAVALADKIDTIVCMFAVSEAPTGSRDPFSVRRAALGAVALILASGLRTEISRLQHHPRGILAQQVSDRLIALGQIAYAGSLPTNPHSIAFHTYSDGSIRLIFGAGDGKFIEVTPDPDRKAEILNLTALQNAVHAGSNDVIQFFADRLKVQQREAGVRHDFIDAVFTLGGEDDLVRLLARVAALQAFVKTTEGTNLLTGYKRAANILKREKWDISLMGEANVEPAEAALTAALDAAEPKAKAAVEAEDFTAAMGALAILREPIDAFFDKVTVNDADSSVRARRLNLLARFRDAVHQVADFSKIEG
jgi:glycyl-tRNA synthetase beta chain